MVLTNIKTAKGGKYETHKTKSGEISTNLWKDSWRTTTTQAERDLIIKIENYDKANDTANLQTALSTLNAIANFGVYIPRANGNRKSGTTSTTTQAQPQNENFDDIKENVESSLKQEQEQEQKTFIAYETMKDLLNKMNDFMSEIIDSEESVLSDRLIDTMLRQESPKEYLLNYYKLQNHPSVNDLVEKPNQKNGMKL